MPSWWLIMLVVVLLVLSAWYLTYTAARLDRLHARVEGSLSALDAQLVRRAEVALEIGNAGCLDAASAFLLVSAASTSLEAAEAAQITHEVQERGLPPERSAAEGELTDALSATVREWAPGTDVESDLKRRLADAAVRVELAHRFHDEAIHDVRRVRRKPLVRIFHLAGHTAMPREVELDDRVGGLDGTSAEW